MVHKNQVMNGICQFVEKEWMPKAENDNDRAVFRTIQAGCTIFPDAVWQAVTKIDFVKMTGAIKDEEVNLDLVERALVYIIGTGEVKINIPGLFSSRPVLITAEDIRVAKTYIERA